MKATRTRTAQDEYHARQERERRATAMATAMLIGTTEPPHPVTLEIQAGLAGDDFWLTWARQAGVNPALYVDRDGPEKVAERRQATLTAYASAWAVRQPADPFEGLDDLESVL